MIPTLRTAVRVGVAGAMMTGLAACGMFGSHQTASSAPPPPPAAQAAAAPTAPVAQVTIRDVQTSLQQAGYYKNSQVDGVWGRRTEQAVQRFQHDHNLTANGKLDVPTLQALNLTGAPPSTGPGAAAPSDHNPPADNNPANVPPSNTPPPANPPGTGAPAGTPPNH